MTSVCSGEEPIKFEVGGAAEEALLVIHVYPGLEKHESHMNWISAKDQISIVKIQTIIGLITDRIDSLELGNEDRSMLMYSGIELVSLRIALAFRYALLNQHVPSQFHLIIAADDIRFMRERNYIGEDYLVGLRYVLQGVNIFNFLQKRRFDLSVTSLPCREIQPFVNELMQSEFDSLSPKVKATILATRHFYDVLQIQSHQEQAKLLEKIIELDPNFYLWRLCSYNIHRHQRQEGQELKHRIIDPTGLEKQHIFKAFELAQDHPFVMASYCVCLAELTNRGKHGSWRQPLSNESREFDSVDDAVGKIKSLIEELLTIHGGNFEVSICAADIFSSLLPWEDFQDLRYAKLCMDKALEIHPNSSKAHYRMGSFFMCKATGDSNYLKEAEKHFARAVECDKNNFLARIQLIKVHMSHPHLNDQKIRALIDDGLESRDLCASRKATIHFLNGCFLLLNFDKDHHPENENLAALQWLKTCEFHSDSLKFHEIYPTLRDYHWPKGKLIPSAVYSVVQKLWKSGKVDEANYGSLLTLCALATNFRDREKTKIQARQGSAIAGNRRHSFGRRNSADVTNCKDSSRPYLNSSKNVENGPRPRRFSSSATANGSVSAQRVTILREPHRPNGPGFNHHNQERAPLSRNTPQLNYIQRQLNENLER